MPNVSIFSTPTCVFCTAAKVFFKKNKISYKEYNVATDLEKRAEMVEKSGQMGVPVIFIDDEIIVGFDETRLRKLLKVK